MTATAAQGEFRGRAARPVGLPEAVPFAAVAERDWRDLMSESAADNVFLHPVFLREAAEALGVAVRLMTSRSDDGRLSGLMPLAPARLGRVAPAFTSWAHDYGPYGAPLLAADGMAGAASALIAGAVAAAGFRKGLMLPLLPAEGPLIAALEAAAHEAERPVTRINDHERAVLRRRIDGVDPRRSLTPKRRKEFQRQRRRMEAHGPVTVQAAATGRAAAAAFEEFLALEAAGWKGRAGTAIAGLPAVARFARRAVHELAAGGQCKVLSLRVGDRPAAMLVCLTARATAWTWKIAYDETLARFSPGAQLMLDAPAILFADPAIELIDSLATPDHPMVNHLWRGRLSLTTLAIGPRHGRALFRLGLTSDRLEGHLRSVLRQLRGRRHRPAQEVPS